jgi:hypothetical protein
MEIRNIMMPDIFVGKDIVVAGKQPGGIIKDRGKEFCGSGRFTGTRLFLD